MTALVLTINSVPNVGLRHFDSGGCEADRRFRQAILGRSVLEAGLASYPLTMAIAMLILLLMCTLLLMIHTSPDLSASDAAFVSA